MRVVQIVDELRVFEREVADVASRLRSSHQLDQRWTQPHTRVCHSRRQGGYVFVGVCLLVCLFAGLRINPTAILHMNLG